MMTLKQAQARLAVIQKDGDKVQFVSKGCEVKLNGTFNMDDMEALFVMLVTPEAARLASNTSEQQT